MSNKLPTSLFTSPHCPPGAKYAAIDIDGCAYFFSKKPRITNLGWAVDGILACYSIHAVKIPGLFWRKSWKKSLIKNQAEPSRIITKRPNLPAWVEVGAYFYHSKIREFCQITKVPVTPDDCMEFKMVNGGGTLGLSIDDLHYARHARVRPWTFTEAPCVLKVKTKDGSNGIAYLGTHDNKMFYHVYIQNPALSSFVTFFRISRKFPAA